MIFLHSYWCAPREENYNYNIDLWYAALSVAYILRHNQDCYLYTDSKGADIFKTLPYTKVNVVLDDLHKTISPYIWSASKFISMQQAPIGSVHLDYDFMLKDFELFNTQKDADMICQHMIPDNNDYQFVSRFIRKACPDLVLPEGITYDFYDHILHLGFWQINNEQLKSEILDKYFLFAQQLSAQMPENLWRTSKYFIPNLQLEEKLVGQIAKNYKVNCLTDIWSENYLDLNSENQTAEHFAGQQKKYRLPYIIRSLKEVNFTLFQRVLELTKDDEYIQKCCELIYE